MEWAIFNQLKVLTLEIEESISKGEKLNCQSILNDLQFVIDKLEKLKT